MNTITIQVLKKFHYYFNNNEDMINNFRYDFIDTGNIKLIRPDQIESMNLKHGTELSDGNDIIVANANEQTGHVLNYEDIDSLNGDLCDYLCHHTPLKFRIKWILNNNQISNYSIAKATGIKQPALSYLKSGKRKIGNISLDSAIALNNYYQNYLYNHLI